MKMVGRVRIYERDDEVTVRGHAGIGVVSGCVWIGETESGSQRYEYHVKFGGDRDAASNRALPFPASHLKLHQTQDDWFNSWLVNVLEPAEERARLCQP